MIMIKGIVFVNKKVDFFPLSTTQKGNQYGLEVANIASYCTNTTHVCSY